MVGELGFGTGLNIAALLDLWSRTRPAGAMLHVFTVEGHPITAEEAAKALARWPDLAAVTDPLVAHWPGRARGFHRIELPGLSALIDVAVMDAGEALDRWSGRADAWFLDGFSPALNPAMWSEAVLAAVAQRSAPGARAATFTVAGAVRRGLAAAGFDVEKRPGFGRKRERLEARLAGTSIDPPNRRVAIVGGGIAGASAARAVRALGGEAVLVEAEAVGAGASGNPAALVTPRLDAGLGPPAELFAGAFQRAAMLYAQAPEAVIARGVRQLARAPKDPDRFAKIAASDLFEPGAMAADGDGLDQRSALVVEPAPILRAWAGETVRAEVAALSRDGGAWRLLSADGDEILRADAVIVAAGQASLSLLPDLPLRAVRGQATWVEGLSASAAAWGGYVLPTRDGLLFGATHDRDDESVEVRAADHARNLETLAGAFPDLAARASALPLEGRAAIRATTPDRLPYAGAIDDGLFVLSGFGSRGFSLAPLLAEHVAALALSAPSPLASDLAALVDPGRIKRRAAKPGHS